MTSEGLEEIFEGDSADMCAGKLPLMSMGGQVEGLACSEPGARTPIDVSEYFSFLSLFFSATGILQSKGTQARCHNSSGMGTTKSCRGFFDKTEARLVPSIVLPYSTVVHSSKDDL